jgi:hypothetical protein
MFIVVTVKTIFQAQFVGIFKIYLRTKFHMSTSNGSLVIVVKLEAEENFRMIAILLLFYIQQRICIYILIIHYRA